MTEELEHSDFLLLHLLVVLEEAVHLLQEVLGQLLDVGVVRDRHVVVGHRDDLVVALPLVQHPHHSDHLRLHQAQRLHLSRADDQDVQRVVVVAVGLRDEAVVVWVVDGAEEDAVELEQSRLLVQLVLDLALGGDLNDGVDDLGCLRAVGHAVPGVLGVELLVLAHQLSGFIVGLYSQADISLSCIHTSMVKYNIIRKFLL